jgi:hypothetical protein
VEQIKEIHKGRSRFFLGIAVVTLVSCIIIIKSLFDRTTIDNLAVGGWITYWNMIPFVLVCLYGIFIGVLIIKECMKEGVGL